MTSFQRALSVLVFLVLADFTYVHGSSGLESILSRCCTLGSDWSRQTSFTTCDNFPAPVSSVPSEHLPVCIAVADICCRRDSRPVLCERGTEAALSDKTCEGKGEAFKDCCEGCKVGIISGSSGEKCRFDKFSFGMPWDLAYAKCCAKSSGSSKPNDLIAAGSDFGNQSICDMLKGDNLCAHLCIPVPGSYRCECFQDFVLAKDGKSCIQKSSGDRCVSNNPCQHTCKDTGFSVECSCRPGYRLRSDRKGCDDIDECKEQNTVCDAQTQVCRNSPGGYLCVSRKDGRKVVPPLETSITDNELATGKQCPVGFSFNQRSQACEDIDECAIGVANCQPEEECHNTIGSFRCDASGSGSCPPGYKLDDLTRSCIDKDECEDETDACDRDTQFCLNSQGGFTCLERTAGRGSCPAGYKKDLSQKSGCTDVNECAEEIHGCLRDQEDCRNTPGAYECDPRCSDGYRFNPATRSCKDIDECIEATVCASAERCVNSPGSFLCVPQTRGSCPQGFRAGAAAGLCDDVDECAEGSDTCGAGEACVNEVGRYRCEPATGATTNCPDGYTFSPASGNCADVDECALGEHNCSPSERCLNEPGTFSCSPACHSGFRVSGPGPRAPCVDIDECSEGLHSCQLATQRCRNTNGSFECVSAPACGVGFRRTSAGVCEDVDECVDRPGACAPGQQCVNSVGSYKCIGVPASSSTASPPPPSSTSASLRPSSSSSSSSRADCPAGFRFSPATRLCLDIDECAEHIYECNNATEVCVNAPGAYRCIKRTADALTESPRTTSTPAPVFTPRCAPGYTFSILNTKCVDIDECLHDPCDSTQRCHNTMGSYSCDCKDGFARDPLTHGCVDINECQLNMASCLATQRCDNTIGSYQCIRYSGCGTGYTLNAATGKCEDDDECALGTDFCSLSGPMWVCRNTFGSFRCERKTCEDNAVLLETGECRNMDCPQGYQPNATTAECEDIDECERDSPCSRGKRCVNTPGSFICDFIIRCGPGYTPSPEGDKCIDVDECSRGTHTCKPGQKCLNRAGSFQCLCPAGHSLDTDGNCIDVDECTRFPKQVCSPHAVCVNTPGSYRCMCKEGFKEAQGNQCEDVNECDEIPNLCEQRCVNLWGSHACGCERGYVLHSDNRSCIDIDECEKFKDIRLCHGDCVNTPGSYKCSCPAGYRLGRDNAICVDIDECETQCRSPDQTCINTRGSYRCINLGCPPGYKQDSHQKNRCNRIQVFCRNDDFNCQREPMVISSSYFALVSNMTIPPSGHLDLLTVRRPNLPNLYAKFDLELERAHSPTGARLATTNAFRLNQLSGSQAVLSLVEPLTGPQDVELRVIMEVYRGNAYAGLNVFKVFVYVSQFEF